MSTAPYAADTPVLLASTLGQAVVVEAVHPDWAAPIPLELTAGTLGWDERRAPRCQLTMTARVPTEQATLDALDPRRGVRLRVRAGYVRPNGAAGVRDVHPVADLQLQDRRVSRPADTMPLLAWGDEGIVLGNSPEAVSSIGGGDLGDAVLAVITAGLGYAPTVVERTMRPLALATPIALQPTQDFWAHVDDVLDRAEADCWDDGLRGWHLTDRPTLDVPALELTVGAGGTLLGAETALTREGWHNAVQVTYTWTTTQVVTKTHELDGALARTSNELATAAIAAAAEQNAAAAQLAAATNAIAVAIAQSRLDRANAARADLEARQDTAEAAYFASGTTDEIVTTEHVVVGTAAVTSGPYAPAAAGGRRVYRETREVATTQAAADGAAATLLGRRLASGRTLDLEAIAAWWLRPGHTVGVRLPAGGREEHLVVAVDFDLTTGRMRLATRLPDTATVITPGA